MDMNIAFVVGNGLDINYGMNTSYIAFYKHIKNTKANEYIENNIFYRAIFYSNVENWADFEMLLGLLTFALDEDHYFTEQFIEEKKSEFASNMSKLNFTKLIMELDQFKAQNSGYKWSDFKKDYTDFCQDFSVYIAQEESDFKNSMVRRGLLTDTLMNFWQDFNVQEKEDFFSFFEKRITWELENKELDISKKNNTLFEINTKFSFLTFNYTDTLEVLLDGVSESEVNRKFEKIIEDRFTEKFDNNIIFKVNTTLENVNHIHATTATGMFLGVDNLGQANKNFFEDRLNSYTLIKPLMISSDSRDSIANYNKIINNSDYIYCFGLSFGGTDKSWWKSIVNSLKSGNRCVIHYYGTDYDISLSSTDRAESRAMIKYKLLNHFTFDFEVENRLIDRIIPVQNSSIVFNSKQ